MARRIKLTVQYDGTDFHGWQAQAGSAPDGATPAVRTVQGELARALREVARQEIEIAGASRTDAGVHAAGNVASFDLPEGSTLTPAALVAALNAHLPEDVSVVAAEDAPADFHAQFSARGKVYRYSIWNAPGRRALLRRTHWHWRQPLDLERMRAAAGALVGTHDFAAFAGGLTTLQAQRAARGRDPLSTVREVRRVDIAESAGGGGGGAPDEPPGRVVAIEVEGSGFLYRMVRAIVGSLVEVGRGRRPPEWLAEALASGDRRRAGPAAPAHGLCLRRVIY